ncbi:MAG: hypothetical protein HYT21_01400 [Candidatus Nealsonbacteria bacterium]|nr:hypothetical protein [Candidatus Nealsonbacteria bacterium]
MFRTMPPHAAVLSHGKIANRGLVLDKSAIYSIPPGTTHIGVKAGILRFLYPQNEKLRLPAKFYRSRSCWKYWPIPMDVRVVAFPAMAYISHQDTYAYGPTGWVYGKPRFA